MRSLRQLAAMLVVITLAGCGGSDGGGGGSPTTPTTPTNTTTRVIGLNGNLAFGSVEIGRTAAATLTIANTGTAALTVTGMTLPAGFSVNWQSGAIVAGGSQAVQVVFAPIAAGAYGGTLTVNGDQTGGTNTIAASGTGTAPTNRAPIITAMNFAPTFGIQQLTTFTFNAAATDPDGDALTYIWDLAGNPFTGQNGALSFSNGFNGTARLTVTDGKAGTFAERGASATASVSFVVGSMTGTWNGVLGPTALGTYRFTLNQSYGVITGTYWDSTFGDGRLDPAEPGAIDAGGNIKMRVKQGPFTDWYFTGTMDNTGRRISGSVRGSGFTGQPFAIVKQ